MKKHRTHLKQVIFLVLAAAMALAAFGCAPSAAAEKTVTDMAGREVSIPGSVERIFCADPMSAITVYTLAPDKLLGWNYSPNDVEKQFMPEIYANLPVFGMNDGINYEAVIDAEPDIAVLTGTLGDALAEKADAISDKTGVPVIVLDNAFSQAPAVYTFLASATGDEAQGKALSDYAAQAFASIADIPQDEQVTVYYANGVDSLNTSSAGSPASALFDMVGAVNVCDLPSDSGDRIGVSKEHVISWNPDYIFVNGEPSENLSGSSAAQSILDDPDYANVTAVSSGSVISIPKAPFAWVDRPRSINRLIGIGWLGGILYPDYYTFGQDEIKEFYSLFYHMELTDEQVDELLAQ